MDHELKNVTTCMACFRLFLNLNKTHFMVFKTKKKKSLHDKTLMASSRTNLRRFCPSVIERFFGNSIPQLIRDKPSKKMFRKALLPWYLAQY